jgi:hypothetical protein
MEADEHPAVMADLQSAQLDAPRVTRGRRVSATATS